MSDFYGTLISSSFRVKDDGTFLADPDVKKIIEHGNAEGGFFEQDQGRWAFGFFGQYPSTVLQIDHDDQDEPEELDICEVIQRHIVDGDVCAIAISGNEKLRYNGGQTAYVSARGTVYVDGGAEWSTALTVDQVKARLREYAEQAETL